MVTTPTKKRDKFEDRYCQDCHFQTNKPSYCKFRNQYTGRKSTCPQWKIKK